MRVACDWSCSISPRTVVSSSWTVSTSLIALALVMIDWKAASVTLRFRTLASMSTTSAVTSSDSTCSSRTVPPRSRSAMSALSQAATGIRNVIDADASSAVPLLVDPLA